YGFVAPDFVALSGLLANCHEISFYRNATKHAKNAPLFDKLYVIAFAIFVFNFFSEYFNSPLAQILNVPSGIRNLVWPLNGAYEDQLSHFGFGEQEINAVTQTMFLNTVTMMALVIVRFYLEIFYVRG